MYIDPAVAINEYQLQVQEAERHIARMRQLEERRAALTPATLGAPARRASILHRLLPRHSA